MAVAHLVDPISAEGGAVHLSQADQWMQGRTMYGGATALIAYTGVIRAFTDLPPLRAAQIAFVAPVADHFTLKREIVRQGKNVTQVRSEILVDGKTALVAFWLFGTDRSANAAHPIAAPDDWPGPPGDAETVMGDKGPAFIQNQFELRRGQEQRGPGAPVVRRWLRLKDHGMLDPVSELILVGDTMPPGAMRAMERAGPISSINWSFNLLTETPGTHDGWWLAENASEWADRGYSSERLRLWDADGAQMLSGMQAVAIFG